MVNILLVDDDDVTRESVRRGLKRGGADFPMTAAEDGREAIEILRGASPTKHIAAPMVVLLDLNMPRMNGFEFLRELRSDAILKKTVVFVLTSSDADADKDRAYLSQISGFMVKSLVGPQYSKLATLLIDFDRTVML
jgi:CheY-like chemotaxis protein